MNLKVPTGLELTLLHLLGRQAGPVLRLSYTTAVGSGIQRGSLYKLLQ